VKRSRSAVRNHDSGQATAEYALLLALVAAGLLVALLLFRTSIGGSYGRVVDRVGNPGGAQETGAMPAGPGAGAGGSSGNVDGPGTNHGCGGGQGGGVGQGGGGCGGGKGH
jgi:Flp pilus assembly pilin Flp